MKTIKTDVVIIGAGPAGSIAAANLIQNNLKVVVIEKSKFPRFMIGESLLPHSMNFLEKVGLLKPVQQFGFQRKRGADFLFNDKKNSVEFSNQIGNGWHYTYQVKRAEFDQLLINCAKELGVEVLFENEVIEAKPQLEASSIQVKDKSGQITKIESRFILDTSGNAAVLGNLLQLNEPSILLPRVSLYSHHKTDFTKYPFDREKITILVHPFEKECWFWVIPFQDNTLSIGFITKDDHINRINGTDSDKLETIINENGFCSSWFKKENLLWPALRTASYSRRIKCFYGNGFAIAGNAGEFLDPVFSSGVTIALKSGYESSSLIIKELTGSSVNWQTEYVDPLLKGIRVFEAFVQGWYNEDLLKIFFSDKQDNEIRSRICAILAGYAWDDNNSLSLQTARRLSTLAKSLSMY